MQISATGGTCNRSELAGIHWQVHIRKNCIIMCQKHDFMQYPESPRYSV